MHVNGKEIIINLYSANNNNNLVFDKFESPEEFII